MSDALPRARRLAAEAHRDAQASAKDGAVRFGRPRNHGVPSVTLAAQEFDAMADDAVVARLREAWR